MSSVSLAFGLGFTAGVLFTGIVVGYFLDRIVYWMYGTAVDLEAVGMYDSEDE